MHGAAFGVQPGEDSLDVAAFEAEVGNWLANSGVEADDPLSLEKTLRGVHGQEIIALRSAVVSQAVVVRPDSPHLAPN